MNQIFNFNRFWNFFKYDTLRSSRSNATKLFSFIVAPVCAWIISGLIGFIFFSNWTVVGQTGRTIAFCIESAIFFIYYSANAYGFLTEKQEGTSWIMIPASVTEKYVTMLLNVLIIAPYVFIVGTLGLDFLYSVIVPNSGGAVIGFLKDAIAAPAALAETLSADVSPVSMSKFSIYSMIVPSSWTGSLVFLLGGICFKKSKIAKTILCYIAASIILSSITAGITTMLPSGSFENLLNLIDSPHKGAFLVNTLIFFMTAVPCIAFAVAVFFRVKTIKH